MKKLTYCILLTGIFVFLNAIGYTQKRARNTTGTTVSASLLADSTFSGLKFRNIGPAIMSGRIADIAIHPKNESIWYVAVGSGGVWKTENSGTTWKPIFDDQKSYSIGCVTIDPINHETIWVGTGENVGGRHVGYGDGVYRSDDGGSSWKNMGLKLSEHISKIIVHPENSNIIWVAAQGPLWTKGGERGLYKSTDGGNTWKKTLGDSEWVGVTDIQIDPRNPDRLYAATWQRHRTVAAYMGGGPGTGIYKSNDGGDTWNKLLKGLPKSNMGKIGLAISPQQPDIIYAAIELDRRTGGLYRSADRGTTWKKRSNAVTGGTGPHYYQELYASPHQFERLYLMDNSMQVSDDGGKTFRRLNETYKHGDNHSITFKKNDPNYLLVGSDGGIYESFDLAKNWHYIENMPITQFYKVALDDARPFYNIYGGTQDNGTHGGPSRTDTYHGIRNSDWKIILDWDGHQPATEPGNPNIVYAERQEGNLSRIDMITGEVIDIQPQPGANEGSERFNWDAPILVSPHSPTRIYFASQRVWRSDNRGNSWKPISGNLTKNLDRINMPIMGKKQSWDAPWDMLAMSNYSTITSLAESPIEEGLIYVGTDDGLIQVTEDGGSTWRKIMVGNLPGVPSTAFVNDIKADLHDVNTLYVVMDNHKYGDFNPYLLKSTDRGKTWRSIKSNIPGGTLTWRIVQDHVKPELLFLATEFGIYFTVNAGGKWIKLKGGVPTISFRDLAIQKRENDLVAASFGRGFFVFDDYSVLRTISEGQLQNEAYLSSVRKAWWYLPRSIAGFSLKGSQGSSHYTAPNPPQGAIFTYYLKDGLKTIKGERQKSEKLLARQNKDIPFPGWEKLEAERNQGKPQIWLTVKDSKGNTVRRISAPTTKGFHRINWDLRFPTPDVIESGSQQQGNRNSSQGLLAAPGTYTVTLSKQVDGVVTKLSDPVTFQVEQLRKGAIEGPSIEQATAFWRSYEQVSQTSSTMQIILRKAMQKAIGMELALAQSTTNPGDLDTQLHRLKQKFIALDSELNGNRSKQEIGEKVKPTINERLFAINRGVTRSTYGPTETHQKTMEIIKNELKTIRSKFDILHNELSKLSKTLKDAGAPWVEGEISPQNK